MSGICGVLCRDGEPIAGELVGRMLRSMADWGPDGSGAWASGAVGLGHLCQYSTPESVGERLPAQNAAGTLVLTAKARLDNRAELLAALDVPAGERAAVPDSTLILLAYERWGEECVSRLLGDWALAVWEVHKRRLFVARAPDATAGLYFFASPHLFAFASSLKALLALPAVPKRLNELRIAQVLVVWHGDGQDTMYRDIRRFPAAHSLSVGPAEMNLRCFWRPGGAPELRLGSDEEYVEALSGVYSEAVRCRLRHVKPVGIALSGGLDSGSIAALASRELRKQGQRLPAFSAVPLHSVDRFLPSWARGDEAPLVEATARHLGNVDVRYVRAAGTTPLAGIRWGLGAYGHPGTAPNNYLWIGEMLDAARQEGVGALLVGTLGNFTISWKGDARRYFRRLLWTGHWGRLGQELGARARRKQRFSWREAVATLAPQAALLAYGRLRGGMHQPTEPWLDCSFVQADFARRINLGEQIAAAGDDPHVSAHAVTRLEHCRWIELGYTLASCTQQEVGASKGVEIWDPTSDRRVVELCLAIPEGQYFGRGLDRWLIRRAMDAQLPPEVVYNQRYGVQAADIVPRLRESRTEVESWLRRLDISQLAPSYLDVKKMKAAVADLHCEAATGDYLRAANLMRAFEVGLFLLEFERASGLTE